MDRIAGVVQFEMFSIGAEVRNRNAKHAYEGSLEVRSRRSLKDAEKMC